MDLSRLEMLEIFALTGLAVAMVGAFGMYWPIGLSQLVYQSFATAGVVVTGCSLVALRRKAISASSQLWAPVTEFITDVEGNWDYFCKLVKRSEILKFDHSERSLMFVEDTGRLVFGGDMFDKGPGDMRLGRALLDLKHRHPDRVTIILGNRDLAPGESGENVDVYWDAKHKPFKAYCEEKGLDTSLTASTLKWMLECTMGCPQTFELRRQELALLTEREAREVPDEEVVESYRSSVDPQAQDPWLLNLLKVGQLAAVMDDCLFVHGGFGKDQLGAVPGLSDKFVGIQDWTTALNRWSSQQLLEFVESPFWRDVAGGKRTRGGDALMDYGLPNGADGKTVVYQHWLANGNCKDLDPVVEAALVKEGIRRVFTGHQPHGQCPSTIKSPQGVQVMMCDTSYSDMSADKSGNPMNNRGNAVSMVTIVPGVTRVRGVLSDGTPHGFVIQQNDTSSIDSYVGRKLKGDWWVKTITRRRGESPQLLIAKGEGFKLSMEPKSKQEVQDLLLD